MGIDVGGELGKAEDVIKDKSKCYNCNEKDNEK